MARTTPVSKGCTILLRPLGMIFPCAEAIVSTLPTGECSAKRRDQAQRDGAADRRRRRLDDFECRRQKRHSVGRAQPARRGGRRQCGGEEGFTR
jgi:hypothetical protein